MSIPGIAAMLLVSSNVVAKPKPYAERDPKKAIAIKPRQAGKPKILPARLRAYAQAKAALRRGAPSLALKKLKSPSLKLISDRVALLKGNALAALGRPAQAKKQYERALEQAQVRSVAISALRGLVSVTEQKKEWDAHLYYIESLLSLKSVSRRPNLVFAKARALAATGKKDQAIQTAWRILYDYPTAAIASSATKFVDRLSKKGGKRPAASHRLRLGRIRNLVRSGAYAKALREMNALAAKAPKLRNSIDMLRVESLKRQKRIDEQLELSQKLLRRKNLSENDVAKLHFQLGKIGMRADDEKLAQRWFDALAEKVPDHELAEQGAYLAAWLPYSLGNHAETTKRMLDFAANHPEYKRRDEALWFAGWCAFLEKKDGLARRSWEQLIEEHPKSETAYHTRYWIGRVRQRAGQLDEAKNQFREVVRTRPLSYYGFLAAERLGELGEKIVLSAPPPEAAPSSFKAVIASLGPKRPVLIDRAIALHAANLTPEALDELDSAERYFRRVKDTEGRTMVADMLGRLGAHHLAFRVGMRIAGDGGDLASGEPYAWRGWRHAYPRAFGTAVRSAQNAHGVTDELIYAIMRTESHFKPYVRSRAGARGLMQIMPKTAQRIGRDYRSAKRHAARYREPESNVWLGTWYLAKLLKQYGNQIFAAAGAYNAGPGAMNRWLAKNKGADFDVFVESITYRETRRYVRRVMETYLVYKRLQGEEIPKLLTQVQYDPKGVARVKF